MAPLRFASSGIAIVRAPLKMTFMGAARHAPASAGASALLALLLAMPVVSVAQDASPSSAAGADETPSPVTVEITPSTSEVTVGETFKLDVKASGPPGTTYAFPAGASDDALEISTPSSEGEGNEASAPAPGTHRYEAVVFALGEVQLPPIPVRYTLPDGTDGQVETEPVPVEVVSMLPKDPGEQKLADIRGPRSASIGPAFWLALVGGLALLAGLVVWMLRRRRRVAEAPAVVVPAVPADVEARLALDELAAAGLLESGALRTFYIRLAAIAKRYLERRLGAPVLEMTTAETLSFLRRHEHGGDLLPVMRDLAEAADRIKFARGRGVVAEAERHLGSVRAMVPALEARLAPPAPAEAGEAA